MKRTAFLSFFLSIMAATPAFALRVGDVNRDTRINLADAVLALQATVGMTTLTPDQQAQADVSPNPGTEGRRIGDGTVTLNDVQQLLRYAVGNLSDAQFQPPAWVTTYAGYGPFYSGVTQQDGPRDRVTGLTFAGFVPASDGSIYFSGGTNSTETLRLWHPDGSTELLAGKPGESAYVDGSADQARFMAAAPLSLLPDGSLLLSDSEALRRYDPKTKTVNTLAGKPILDPSGTPEQQDACRNRYKDGPAKDALFGCGITAAVAAPDGTIYIADNANQRIRVLLPNGTVKTFTGSGKPTYYPVDGPPDQVRFASLRDLALDANGTLWISDGSSIRKADSQGNVTIVAGQGPSGDDGPGRQVTVDVEGITFGPNGWLYFADPHYRIRALTPDRQVVTVAGSTTQGYQDGPVKDARFWFLGGIRADAQGDLLIGDGNGYLRRLRPDGIVDTLSESVPYALLPNGPARRTRLDEGSSGLTFGPDGSLFFDEGNRIRRVTPDGREIQFVAGYPVLFNPTSTDFPPPNVKTELADMSDLAAAPDGSIYTVHTTPPWVRRVVSDGQVDLLNFPIPSSSSPNDPLASVQFNQPTGIVIDPKRQIVYIANTGDNDILAFDLKNGLVGLVAGMPHTSALRDGSKDQAGFLAPGDMDIDADGNLYVLDRNQAIRKVTPDGNVSTLFRLPTGDRRTLNDLAHAPDGSLYVTGYTYVVGSPIIPKPSAIYRLSPGSSALELFAGDEQAVGYLNGPAHNARFWGLNHLAVDKNENLYVSDTANSVIREIEP